MLDAFIIEEIRKREQERDGQRPRLELPLPEPEAHQRRREERGEEQPERGVVIIDYSVPA
jgi:hypothetical protein